MPAQLRVPDVLDEEYLEQLLRLSEWHREIAVGAAADHCVERNIQPPNWIVPFTASFLPELLRGQKSARRGRSCNPVARYRQDQIDYIRWDAVISARENQPKILHRVKQYRAYPSYPAKYLQLEEKLLAWIGSDWIRAYEVASMYLQGSYAHAGPDAVRASYLRVRKHFASNMGARYIPVREPFRYKIGIPHPRDEQGMKCLHLFELTI